MAVVTLGRCDAGRACDVKLDGEELSQLNPLDAIGAAAERDRG